MVQLGFLGIFVLHSTSKSIGRVRKHGTDFAGQGVEKSSIPISFSTICILMMACSLALMGARISVILMLLNGSRNYCKRRIYAFSSEALQVLFWAASAIAVHKVVKNELIKFSWLLRSWWLWSFVMSMIHVAFDTHLVITNRSELRLRDYADFFCFLVSTCLFIVSIRGKTGIVLHEPNGITEPFLNGQSDKHIENKRVSAYAKASLLQLVTFSWLNPLFAVGFKKPLNQNEIPDLDIKDSAACLSSSFDESLKCVKEKDGTTNPSIYRVICTFAWRKAGINACFAVINAGASYVGPYLINDFVSFLSEKETRSLKSGYFLALAFLGAKMVETTTQRQWIFGARQLGLRLRAALISHIYRKGLALSSRSRQSRTSGEMINYMSVDIQRITDFMWYLNIIFMLPVQISFAIFILHTNLDLGSMAALATTLLVMSLNVPLTRIQKRYQMEIMEAKDNRMKANSEVLRNMKILKLQAWDMQFLHKLEGLRKLEYNCLWKLIRVSAVTAFIFWGAPTLISVVTFGSCILMGIELTAGRVLSALATFRMLQDPIFNLPDLLNVIAQGKVSADRVASFLQEEEIQQDAIQYVPKSLTEFAVEVHNGKFSWDPESRIPTLDGVNLRVKRGVKVAICGTVGSGKSSLLASILGEMHKLSGSVKISGTKAYVPQTPWILTGNIRENILYGNEYDSAKYDRTVKACALMKDFELFSCGDQTEIGERGINMSGGQKQRIQIARAVYQDADIYLLDDPFSAVDAHTGTQLFKVSFTSFTIVTIVSLLLLLYYVSN